MLFFIDVIPQKRCKIGIISEHNFMSYKNVAKEFGVGSDCIKKLIKGCNETGSVSLKCADTCGRKRKTTSIDDSI